MTDTWTMPDDARTEGMEYPYYSMMQSPSGNGMVIDDTKEHESLTFFHRSGSMIQLQPDGSLVIINQKDAYSVTFGDNNVMITGGQNVTINGGASLKVEGDYDMTVKGNMRQIIEGDSETIISGNHKMAVVGDNEIGIGGDSVTQIQGKSQEVASEVNKGSTGSMLTTADGTHIIKGSRVDINPS